MSYNLNNSANAQTTTANLTATCAGGATTAGSVSIVFVGFGNITSTLTLSDSVNGAYTQAGPYVRLTDCSIACFYRANTAATAMTMTATFNASAPNVDMLWVSYSGTGGTAVTVVNSKTGTGTTSPGTTAANTTAAQDDISVFGGYTDGAFGTTPGTGWTEDVSSVDGSILASQETTTAVSISGNCPMTFAATYVMLMVEFNLGAGGGGGTLRPGPIAGAPSITSTNIFPRVNVKPFTGGNVGSVITSGVFNPHFLLRPKASGTITTSGTATSSAFTLRPNLPNTLTSVTGVINPRLVQHAIDPGPLTGTIGVVGAVHGYIGTPNKFFVTCTTMTPHIGLRPGTGGALHGSILTSGVVNPKDIGNLRPFGAGGNIGTVLVTGFINPRFNPLRVTINTGNNINVTNTRLNPRLIGGAPLDVPLTTVPILVTNTRLNPEFILFPGAVGSIRTSGGTTNPRLVLRVPSTGTVNVSGVITPHLSVYPGAVGEILVTGVVNPRSGGVLRPQAFGELLVTGLVSPHNNPLLAPITGQINTSIFIINPRLVGVGPHPVIVHTSGYYVVEDVARAFLVMFLEADVDYGFAVYSVEFGPYDDYQTALSVLMAFAAEFFPNA